MNGNRSDAPNMIGRRILLRLAIFALLFPALLFVMAGRLDWVMGWIYASMIIAFTVASRLAVMLKSHELMAERAQFAKAGGIWISWRGQRDSNCDCMRTPGEAEGPVDRYTWKVMLSR